MATADNDVVTPLRVLVVDDHAALRAQVAAALDGEDGLTVVGDAADGSAALLQTAALRPDVVLMDLSMPGVDGVQATRILRRRHPDVAVVLWTGQDAADLARAVRAAGADAGVLKGIRLTELTTTLRGAWAGARRGYPRALPR